MSDEIQHAQAALGKVQTLVYLSFTTFDYFKKCCSTLYKGLTSDSIYNSIDLSQGKKEEFLYGREFKTEEIWSRYLASQGLSMDPKDTMELSLNDKRSINEFKKLCRKYGVDIGIMNRPEDIDLIVRKANLVAFDDLSTREQKVINAYAQKNESGQYVAKPGAVTIAFKTSDLGRITKIQERMEAKQKSLQDRLKQVEERKQQKEMKKKEQIKEKVNPSMER